MTIEDFSSISFGICIKIGNDIIHNKIPIDNSVKETLVDMRNSFSDSYDSIPDEPEQFSPIEKYSSVEKLSVSLNQDYLASINDLFHHQNPPLNNIDLSEYLPFVDYYFAEFIHNNGAKTIGVKRPNQFKALLKKRIVRLWNDTLQAVEDDV